MQYLTIRRWVLAAVTSAAALYSAGGAQAYTLDILHSFCGQANCTDGKDPLSDLVMDPSGNFFGTTYYGGDANLGTVFELSPGQQPGQWVYQRLYSFCAKASCTDGSHPDASVVIDTSGNLYGTTSVGGKTNHGEVFELSPNSDRSKWRLHLLHQFCDPFDANCHDGAYPPQLAPLTYKGAASGALYDGSSALYGVTTDSSAENNGWGVVFQVMFDSAKGKWKEKIVHWFCLESGCPDGGQPAGPLTVDGRGNLFGTTGGGGTSNSGTLFKLSHKQGQW